MASRSGRTGMYLSASDREALLEHFAKYEKRKRQQLVVGADNYHDDENDNEVEIKDGCRVCRKDNDHSNMLICERCSAEYHFYCIDLKGVPNEDWFCDKCKPQMKDEDDGLDLRVAALPPSFTSRFGQVVWAQGGPGYGWWPSYVYDPRMTVGGARDLAKKNLNKKHLIYFFQCLEAPFAALPDTKICEWYTGLTESYHLGKAARNSGKNRGNQFSEALKIANLELDKPVEHRMDWNHPDPTLLLVTSPVKTSEHRATNEILEGRSAGLKRRKRGRPPKSEETQQRQQSRRGSVQSDDKNDTKDKESSSEKEFQPNFTLRPSVRTNLLAALEAHNNAAKDDEEDLYLRVMRDRAPGDQVNLGFVTFGSRRWSTFWEARQAICKDMEMLRDMNWKFYIPELGPLSARQEKNLGPMILFLQKTSTDMELGDGTIRRPAKVVIIEADDKRVSY